MGRLSKTEIERDLREIKGWTRTGKEIQKTFAFKDFLTAIQFVNKVADLAEKEFHHPDILISYNKVSLTLTSHDVGALSQKDFRLARKIERL